MIRLCTKVRCPAGDLPSAAGSIDTDLLPIVTSLGLNMSPCLGTLAALRTTMRPYLSPGRDGGRGVIQHPGSRRETRVVGCYGVYGPRWIQSTRDNWAWRNCDPTLLNAFPPKLRGEDGAIFASWSQGCRSESTSPSGNPLVAPSGHRLCSSNVKHSAKVRVTWDQGTPAHHRPGLTIICICDCQYG